MSQSAELVAFGGYYCGCTYLAEHVDDVPRQCPEHGHQLVERPCWERRPSNVSLGYEPTAPKHACDEFCQVCEGHGSVK